MKYDIAPHVRLPSLLSVAAFALLIAGQASADPVPLAVDPLNVADDGTAGVYETTGGGLVLPVDNANDTEYSGDTEYNLMTITGEWLGIQIDLAGPSSLKELGAYVDPNGGNTDTFKNTDSVEFLISTNDGASYASLGLGAFTDNALGNFSYVNVVGSYVGVTNVRYRFHQANGGSEGQRIPELLALLADDDGDGVPNDSDACPGTVIPEGVPTDGLGTNRWALVDDDLEFDTTPPSGKGPGRSYTTADTGGCSCEQIIDELGLGKGHTKFGCSIGAMDNWVDLIHSGN